MIAPSLFLATLLSLAGGSRPASAQPVPTMELPGEVRPVHYALELDVDPARESFEGQERIDLVLESARRTLWLHARGLRVRSATAAAGGKTFAATFTQATELGVARIDLPEPIGPGPATLTFSWSGDYTEGSGPGRQSDAAGAYVATLLEPIEARRLFPCFDEPRWKTPFDITLNVPGALVAVSNAAAASHEVQGARSHIVFGTTPPLPTYLLFVAVGPFETVETQLPPGAVRTRPLPVRYLVPRGRTGEVALARETTEALVPALEAYFGLPFPYEKLDHVAAPGYPTGMENAGAIAYPDVQVLFDPIRRPTADRVEVAVTVAHELAHQWFGDLVSPPAWTDVWLNESFAEWMGHRSIQRWRPDLGAETEALDGNRAALFADARPGARAIRAPLKRMEEVDAQFGVMAYMKGAAVLAMVERFVGEARFQGAIGRYLAAHAQGTGSTPALIQELSRAAGRDLDPVLGGFLDRPGAPLIRASITCSGGRGTLHLHQERLRPAGMAAAKAPPWQVPVCTRYRAGSSEEESCTLLTTTVGEVPLEGGCPDWFVPNADGAGYYAWTLPSAQLSAVLRAAPRLTAGERASLASSIEVGFKAGAVPHADVMRARLALAADIGSAGTTALQALRTLQAHAGVARPEVADALRKLLTPQLERLGWTPVPGESVDDANRRVVVVKGLLETGAPRTREEAAQRGRAWLGLDGTRDPGAIDPSLADVAGAAAIDAEGVSAFERTAERLATLDAGDQRRPFLYALARARSPALGDRFYALLAGGQVATREIVLGLAEHVAAAAEEGEDDAVLAGLERHLPALLGRLQGFEATWLPYLGGPLCTRASAAQFRALFHPYRVRRPELVPGVEKISQVIVTCAAAVERERAALTAAQEKQGRSDGAGRTTHAPAESR